MSRSMRRGVMVGGIAVLLAAMVGAGSTFALAMTRDAGSVGADDSADAAQSGATQVVSRRIVINGVASPGVKLLTIPGLGVLNATCESSQAYASVVWNNTTGASVDGWSDYDADGFTFPFIATAATINRTVAFWDPGNQFQIGTRLDLGQGNSPGPRKTASISIHAYRSGTDAPCGLQATATTWHTP